MVFFSSGVHEMIRKMSGSMIVEPLHAEILHDDDDGVVGGGLERGVELGPPCALGISLPCGQYVDGRLAP